MAVHPTGVVEDFPAPDALYSFPQRFGEIAARHGRRIALRGAGASETYAELDARTNAMARALLAELGPGSEPVALWFDHTPDAIRACIAVLKAGKCYVPLDAAAPDVRNAQILDECHARALWCGVSGRDADDLLRHCVRSAECRALDAASLAVGVSTAALDVAVGPRDPAYITFTSGSTGAPKGVVEDHGDALYVASLYHYSHHLCPEDCVGLWRRWAFGGGQLHLYAALCTGASLSLLPPGAGVARWMADDSVTVTTASPSMLRALLDSLDRDEQLPASLRAIVIGSEPLLVSDVERLWRIVPPGCVLRNTFGATEALSATEYFLAPDDRFEGDVVPVGWGTGDGEMLVLRADGARCAVGEIGDVFVRRRCTAAGYWQRPAETQERFFDEPDGIRRYRFGDRGRLTADGCLEVLGRDDDVVKINGFSASIAAVEAALGRDPAVQAAAVFSWTDGSGQTRLAAQVVVRGGVSVERLRRSLAERVPSHAVPARIDVVDALPLTATGKLDRRALVVAATERPVLERAYVAPRDELEQRIVAIWESVLQMRPIGVHDAFFDLGGDSLRAAQVSERLRRMTGRDLPVAFLQRASTPARTASILREENDGAPDPFLVPVRVEGDLPPLIICPPGGGIDVRFLQLASFLSERQPVYLLRPAGLDGRSEPHDTLEAMVEAYADSLSEAFGDRPLRFLGACRGTFVAMALAQQKVSRGSSPDALIVVDLPLPDRSITHRAVSGENTPRMRHIGVRRWLDVHTAQLRLMVKGRWLNAKIVRTVADANNRAFDRTKFVTYRGRALVVESLRPSAERRRFAAWRDLLVGEYAHVCMESSTHRELMSGRHSAELGRVLRDWLGE